MRRATINDVAKQAGVSKATVSHVVNNTRFVEEETRQKVLRVIELLGYHPSIIARSLTTNRTETIGVIVSDVTNSFFGDVLHGMEEITRPAGYSLVVCNTDEILEREDYFIDLLLRQRVDGIIAAATSRRWDALNKAENRHTPIVFVDRMYEGLTGSFVGVNNQQGAYDGTKYILERGHRKVGVLAGFQRLSTMRERLAGFRAALDDFGVPLPPQWVVESPLRIEAGKEAALRLLTMEDRPTAMLTNNNLLSLGAFLAINELKMRCPEDIAIVGFDDHPWAAVSCPPLTVVRQPSWQLGKKAGEILLNMVNGGVVEDTRVLLDCELVIRQSC